ncbi:hypothetical protein [Bacillus cereus]|uniref:hypothetical protein n=1 Tax=Bacillus cereus TaxID=1396 RepID=UPI000BFE62DF|nr:hypothetical protein [Bacillus cereus]PGR83569.1 hypothetical protein COC63_06180 [Bacillus cereus]
MKENWLAELRVQSSTLVLKQDHKELGKKGSLYYVPYTFAELSTGLVKYVVADMLSVEGEVQMGIYRFLVTEEELLELFSLGKIEVEDYIEKIEAHKDWLQEDGVTVEGGFRFE